MKPSYSDWHVWSLVAYLEEYAFDASRPWMLAISGGVDSMVLLDAFIQVSCNSLFTLPSQIFVAHLNHGWREEAYKDLQLIEKFLQKNTGPTSFILKAHHVDLSGCLLGENAEAVARKARYDFFERLGREAHAKTLFLAHHLQDKQETFFKNLFEGKELVYLDGLKKYTHRKALELARPFLSLGKKELVAIASRKGIPFEHDVTNEDSRYLRARMRQRLEPLLDEIWPTAWKAGIQQTCEYLEEWKTLLDASIDTQTLSPVEGILGLKWSLAQKTMAMKAPAVRYWLRSLSSLVDPLEREGSHRLSKALLEGVRDFRYRSRLYLWSVHSTDLFALDPLYQDKIPKLFERPSEADRLGPWRTGFLYDPQAQKLSNVTAFWQGYWTSPNFAEGQWVELSKLPQKVRREVLHRYQTRHVPSFLRKLAPVWISDFSLSPRVWMLTDPWPKEALKEGAAKTWIWDS